MVETHVRAQSFKEYLGPKLDTAEDRKIRSRKKREALPRELYVAAKQAHKERKVARKERDARILKAGLRPLEEPTETEASEIAKTRYAEARKARRARKKELMGEEAYEVAMQKRKERKAERAERARIEAMERERALEERAFYQEEARLAKDRTLSEFVSDELRAKAIEDMTFAEYEKLKRGKAAFAKAQDQRVQDRKAFAQAKKERLAALAGAGHTGPNPSTSASSTTKSQASRTSSALSLAASRKKKKSKDWIPEELVGISKSDMTPAQRRLYAKAKKRAMSKDEYNAYLSKRRSQSSRASSRPRSASPSPFSATTPVLVTSLGLDAEAPYFQSREWVPEDLRGRAKSTFTEEERKRYNKAKKAAIPPEDYAKLKALRKMQKSKSEQGTSGGPAAVSLLASLPERTIIRSVGDTAESSRDPFGLDESRGFSASRKDVDVEWKPGRLARKSKDELTEEEREEYRRLRKERLGKEEYAARKAAYVRRMARKTADAPWSIKSDKYRDRDSLDDSWKPEELRGLSKREMNAEQLRKYKEARKASLSREEYLARKAGYWRRELSKKSDSDTVAAFGLSLPSLAYSIKSEKVSSRKDVDEGWKPPHLRHKSKSDLAAEEVAEYRKLRKERVDDEEYQARKAAYWRRKTSKKSSSVTLWNASAPSGPLPRSLPSASTEDDYESQVSTQRRRRRRRRRRRKKTKKKTHTTTTRTTSTSTKDALDAIREEGEARVKKKRRTYDPATVRTRRSTIHGVDGPPDEEDLLPPTMDMLDAEELRSVARSSDVISFSLSAPAVPVDLDQSYRLLSVDGLTTATVLQLQQMRMSELDAYTASLRVKKAELKQAVRGHYSLTEDAPEWVPLHLRGRALRDLTKKERAEFAAARKAGMDPGEYAQLKHQFFDVRRLKHALALAERIRTARLSEEGSDPSSSAYSDTREDDDDRPDSMWTSDSELRITAAIVVEEATTFASSSSDAGETTSHSTSRDEEWDTLLHIDDPSSDQDYDDGVEDGSGGVGGGDSGSGSDDGSDGSDDGSGGSGSDDGSDGSEEEYSEYGYSSKE